MVLFSTFLLSNIDSSLLFNYRFPTIRLELSIEIDGVIFYFSFIEYRFICNF